MQQDSSECLTNSRGNYGKEAFDLAKQHPNMNLPEVLEGLAWLDVYLDALQLEVGVPDLYSAVYGEELPAIQIDVTDSQPKLLFDICESLERNGYEEIVHEFFTLLMDHQIDVASWTIKEIPHKN